MTETKMILINNKKARHEYHVLDTFVAGMKLEGTEVKALRDNRGSIAEAYCFFNNGELFVKNMHIGEWKFGNINNHDPLRVRKLLLTKKELRKLESKVAEKGMTIVPLNVHVAKSGYIKISIALVKGKKLWDKKATIRERDIDRETNKILKNKI